MECMHSNMVLFSDKSFVQTRLRFMNIHALLSHTIFYFNILQRKTERIMRFISRSISIIRNTQLTLNFSRIAVNVSIKCIDEN